MHEIACVGILVADAITKTVDKMPERGRLGLVDSIRLYSGGCAMNAAAALAKLGERPAIFGMIGDDGFGAFLMGEIERLGINSKGLIIDGEAGTSASVALIDGGGERTFLHSIGANGVFSEAHIKYEIIEECKIVFVAGAMLMPGFDGEGCRAFLEKARSMGKTTVLDTAWDDKGRWMSVLGPSLEHLDYFLPSLEEAAQLSGEADPKRAAEVFLGRGAGTVVIKLGSEGCYLKERGGEGVYIPTYTHIKPVDTTGAGDSFCAGFLYGLSAGMSHFECCRIANAVGTHCVMAVGASTGIKPYHEIEKFIKEHEL